MHGDDVGVGVAARVPDGLERRVQRVRGVPRHRLDGVAKGARIKGPVRDPELGLA